METKLHTSKSLKKFIESSEDFSSIVVHIGIAERCKVVFREPSEAFKVIAEMSILFDEVKLEVVKELRSYSKLLFKDTQYSIEVISPTGMNALIIDGERAIAHGEGFEITDEAIEAHEVVEYLDYLLWYLG